MKKVLAIFIPLMPVNPVLSFSKSKGIAKKLENISGQRVFPILLTEF